MLGLPSVYINRKRHIVPHDRIHDGSLVISSSLEVVPHFNDKNEAFNSKKREEFQNSPDNRRHDIVNVTVVHVGQKWCVQATRGIFQTQIINGSYVKNKKTNKRWDPRIFRKPKDIFTKLIFRWTIYFFYSNKLTKRKCLRLPSA